MYKLLGDRLILNEELVGTFTKDELIEYLLQELNDSAEELVNLRGVAEELEEALDEISSLELDVAELQEELSKYENE